MSGVNRRFHGEAMCHDGDGSCVADRDAHADRREVLLAGVWAGRFKERD